MIKAHDHGYFNFKDSDHRIFKSAYSLTDETLMSDEYIAVDNVNYYVGTGNTTADIDKINDKINEVTTLYSIAKCGSGEYNIVVGLPIVQYKELKVRYKETILGYNKRELIYKKQKIKFVINDVHVLPQGAGAIYSIKERNNCIILDIGSYTINIALFENDFGQLRLAKSDTIFKGILHLYQQVIKEVNSSYTLNLDVKYAESIIRDGLSIPGNYIGSSFVKPILFDYLKPIITQFKTSYPHKIYPIYLCGGGGLLLKDIFAANFSNVVLMPDAQFSNVNGFYNYGLNIWR